MVAAVVSTTDPRNPPRDRQDKLQSVTNNGGQRRPRGKQVPSRYLSPSPSHSVSSNNTTTTTTTTTSSSSSASSSSILSPSKRYPSPSPLLSRSNSIKTPSLLPKRSHSVDRRRPSAAPVNVGGSGSD